MTTKPEEKKWPPRMEVSTFDYKSGSRGVCVRAMKDCPHLLDEEIYLSLKEHQALTKEAVAKTWIMAAEVYDDAAGAINFRAYCEAKAAKAREGKL